MLAASSPIRPAVRAAFVAFNEPFEGRCRFMYCDRRGLVTTGMGNLIDPVASALHLPWQRPDGTSATLNEIQDAWIAVKDRQDLRMRGGGVYAKLTTLRLTDAAVDALIFQRLDQMGATLQAEHPCFADLPADAQLAILSMSWAMGPAFRFPHFWALVESGDFAGAAKECTINPNIGTIVHRNEANRRLLLNAATVRAQAIDPSVLQYPGDVAGA